MFRIRRIYEDTLSNEARLLTPLKKLFKENFEYLTQDELKQIFNKVSDPEQKGFKHYFFVAEHSTKGIQGALLCSHHTQLNFMYLDYLVANQKSARGGVGSILYQRARETAGRLNARDLFLECNSDNPSYIKNSSTLKKNKSRIRFYERFGAQVVEGTAFEIPRSDGYSWSLMYDSLNTRKYLSKGRAVEVVKKLLSIKDKQACPQSYKKRVLGSFTGKKVTLRPITLQKNREDKLVIKKVPQDEAILLTQSEEHMQHHVKDRGYYEVPIRLRELRRGLNRLDIFNHKKTKKFPDKHILAVHDSGFYRYLKKFTENMSPGEFLYPEVFPIRAGLRPPVELKSRAGYYATDSFTPISKSAFIAAREGVDCSLTAAQEIVDGRRFAYALVRPPGHHAEREAFGGFCYLNSTAIAAHYLSQYGRVAILDLDYHHGNGQQDIFYERKDVLTISIHADPRFEYPHFSGYSDEKGSKKGLGYNINYPCPLEFSGKEYLSKARKAVNDIASFNPSFFVVALGFDTAQGDPTGSWSLSKEDFRKLGQVMAGVKRPSLFIQEGGYRTRSLASNAREFFHGLWTSSR